MNKNVLNAIDFNNVIISISSLKVRKKNKKPNVMASIVVSLCQMLCHSVNFYVKLSIMGFFVIEFPLFFSLGTQAVMSAYPNFYTEWLTAAVV